MVAVLVGSGVVGTYRSQPPLEPTPAGGGAVEVIVDGELIGTDGRRTRIDDGAVLWAARIPAGLMYLRYEDETPGDGSYEGPARARLRRDDGKTVELGSFSRAELSRDGHRVAYVSDANEAVTATITADGLTGRTVVPVGHEGAGVVGWYGDRPVFSDVNAVAPGEEGGYRRYALLDASDPKPQWHDAPEIMLLEPSADPRGFLGLRTRAAGDCLVLVDPEDRFRATREACLPEFAGGMVVPSPDGRYLAVITDAQVRILDTATAFDTPRWYDDCRPGVSEEWAGTWVAPDILLTGIVCRVLPSGEIDTDVPPPVRGNVPVAYVERVGDG